MKNKSVVSPARPDVCGDAGPCWACRELALDSFPRSGMFTGKSRGPHPHQHLFKRPNIASKECGLRSGSDTGGDPFRNQIFWLVMGDKLVYEDAMSFRTKSGSVCSR